MKLCITTLLTLLLASHVSASSSVALTLENYNEKTKGKAVFIKFFAPWCTYCQELAPTWEQLAKEWADHEKVLIGEIDCTVQKSFCKSMIGLPTLQYGDPFGQGSFLIDYNGEKDSDSLLQFVNDTLVSPICGPSNFDACEPVMSGRLKYFMSMGIGELEGAVRDHETQIESAQNKFDHEFKLLKVEYDAAASEHQRLTTRIQSTIKLIKSVQEYRQRGKFWKRKNGEL